MHEVGSLASIARVRGDRHERKAPVTKRQLHRQRAGHPGPLALPDAVPDLGHALRLGEGPSLVERSVANLPLAEQTVFLRVAIGLLGGVWGLVKDPYLTLGLTLQPYEGLAHVDRTFDHLDKLGGVTGAEAGPAGCGE